MIRILVNEIFLQIATISFNKPNDINYKQQYTKNDKNQINERGNQRRNRNGGFKGKDGAIWFDNFSENIQQHVNDGKPLNISNKKIRTTKKIATIAMEEILETKNLKIVT
jgi:hypothetical protein